MNKKYENFAEGIRQKKRYKAVEKKSHEIEMEMKSWAIENSLYYSPLIIAVMGWFIYGLINEMNLPYGESFDFLDSSFIVVLAGGVAFSFLTVLYVKPIIKGALDKEEKELTADVYQKGSKFCTLEGFNKNIDKYMNDEYLLSKDIKCKETFRIPMMHLDKEDSQYHEKIEDLKIARISLATALCIMGAPGQGKSVLINQVIKQTPKESKQIIIDVKGEFIEKHFDSKTDFLICPSDIRSVRFNLVNLLHSKIDTGIIAEILIADEQSNDPHFVAAGRGIMEAILVYAAKRNLSNKSIHKLVSDPIELKKILKDEEAKLLASPFLFFTDSGEPSRETKSTLSTLARKAKILQYLAYMDDLDTEKIYLDDWIKDKNGGKLFLLATDNLSKIFAPLYGVISSYLISTLLDQEDSTDKDYYFIFDELPRLGKVLGENLEKALAVGRSKGIKVLMAMQSYSQIKEKYGDKQAESILDTTNSFIIFKNNYGAQFLEKLFGKTTVIRNNESFSFGMHSMADRSQLQRQMVKENLIDDSEINRLNKFEIYAKIDGSRDILKTKLKPVFVNKNGIKKYIENPAMKINVLVHEMEVTIIKIENKYIDISQPKNKTKIFQKAYCNM